MNISKVDILSTNSKLLEYIQCIHFYENSDKSQLKRSGNEMFNTYC